MAQNRRTLAALLKQVIYYVLLSIRSFFFLLAKISFVLIIIFVGVYAFYVNDQGLDMMAAFSFMTVLKDGYISLAILFFVIWAMTIWNVCRILLGAANLKRLVESEVDPATVLPDGHRLKENLIIATVDPNYKKIIETLIKWVPRLLLLLPYMIFIMSYTKENGTTKVFNIVIVIVVGILHFVLIIFRRPIAKKILLKQATRTALKDERSYSWEEEKNVWHAVRTEKVLANTIFTSIVALCVFAYALIVAFSIPTDPGRPGLIILSGLIVYTLIGMAISLYANKYKIPVFIIMVLFAVFFASSRNDNHSIQVLSTDADLQMVAQRKQDSVYCREWIENKMKNGAYDTSKQNTIFLVAAEGGGIRSCYWTYLVLQKLQNLQPSFYEHTFAVTGASGGSMGLGFYYNFIYHNREKLDHRNFMLRGEDSMHLDAICSADYLSRVTYAFLYPDLIQRFIPWSIESWDRGKYLANSFNDGFSGKFEPANANLLNRNFQEMWSGAEAYDRPAILFNTTYAERGSKAVFSPFILSPKNYADALDILTVTKRAIPMKEGMASSARFPVLTPSGLIYYKPPHDKNDKLKKFGHIFDGGGFENTGIQTAQQTAVMIKRELAKKGLADKFRIVIIYIGYGTGSMMPDNTPVDQVKYKPAIGSAYELSSVMGGANTIFQWIYSAHGLTVQLDPDMNLLEFGLRTTFDSTKHKLPLGLYMSRTSKDIMQKEILDSGTRTYLKRAIKEFNKSF